MSSMRHGVEFKKKGRDKIEAARSYDNQHFGKEWPEIVEADARQEGDFGRGDNFLDAFMDEEDGIVAMFKSIRDLLFPPANGECVGERTDTDPSPQKKNKPMPAWQADTIDQFLRAWHRIEVSTAANMLVTDEDYSVLAIFRDVGSSTFDELSTGTRRLSQSILANMRLAVEATRSLSTRALLTAKTVMVPAESSPALTSEPMGDVTMAGMFKAEEWS